MNVLSFYSLETEKQPPTKMFFVGEKWFLNFLIGQLIIIRKICNLTVFQVAIYHKNMNSKMCMPTSLLSKVRISVYFRGLIFVQAQQENSKQSFRCFLGSALEKTDKNMLCQNTWCVVSCCHFVLLCLLDQGNRTATEHRHSFHVCAKLRSFFMVQHFKCVVEIQFFFHYESWNSE